MRKKQKPDALLADQERAIRRRAAQDLKERSDRERAHAEYTAKCAAFKAQG